VGYAETIGGTRYIFPDVKTLLAKATPRRSGDLLAGIAAADATERVAAQRALANLPVRGPATRCTQCLSPGASPPRSRPTGAKPSCCAPPPATGRPICDAPTWAGGSLGKRLATEASRLVPEPG